MESGGSESRACSVSRRPCIVRRIAGRAPIIAPPGVLGQTGAGVEELQDSVGRLGARRVDSTCLTAVEGRQYVGGKVRGVDRSPDANLHARDDIGLEGLQDLYRTRFSGQS